MRTIRLRIVPGKYFQIAPRMFVNIRVKEYHGTPPEISRRAILVVMQFERVARASRP